MNRLLLMALISSAFFASCSSDDNNNSDEPLGSYDNGVLALNEGGFGTVTYISQDLATVQQDVFDVVNGSTQNLGTYAQSMFFDGDKAFVISNGSNKITVVNRYTFEYINTISTGLAVPRYGVVYNGKAYVTNANSFASNTDDYIAVINLATMVVEDPIAVNNYAEKLVAGNGKLYVSGGFYYDGDVVTVIDADSKSIVTTIPVGATPNSLEIFDGTLFVLCGNLTDPSKLVKVQMSNYTIIDEIVFPDSMGNAQNLDIDNQKIYFNVGPKVHKISLNAITVLDTPLFNTNSTSDYIGYGFAAHNGRIYISEAAEDFTSDGKILIYTTSGELVDDVPAGLGPNGFYFND